MDMVEGYSDTKNPIAQKSQFIMSLLEQLDQSRELSSIDKSIIDRCTGDLYKNYRQGGPLPTQSRIIVYDILDLGEQLKTMGLLVITDAILNRVTENWKAGRRTHVYLDEFHVVYDNPYSSMFFTSAWRRFRKRNAFPTGITQNVEYLLDNASARSLLSNSEFVVMHNQAASDREKLAVLFNIHHQRRGGTRLNEDRQRACAFRQQVPEEHRAISQNDDEARGNGVVGVDIIERHKN